MTSLVSVLYTRAGDWGYIAVKIESLYTRDNSASSKTWFVTQNKSGFWGATDSVDLAVKSNSIFDAITVAYHALEERNSWSMYRKYSAFEFNINHRISFHFQTSVNGKVENVSEITGTMLNYFIHVFDLGSNKTPRFVSCVYKGKRYRVIDDNYKSIKLHDGRWVDKASVTERKTIK